MSPFEKIKIEFDNKYEFMVKLGIDTKEHYEEIKQYYIKKIISQK